MIMVSFELNSSTMKFSGLIILVGLVCFSHAEELLSVQVLFRHGDRTPVATYPNDPYNNVLFTECEAGQLTAQGKRRHYALGQWLRERYSDFFPETYSNADVLVMTSDVDRTHMSAASNLAGLFPPKNSQIWNSSINWQPIPIHLNVPVLQGELLNCPRYDKLIEERDSSEIVQSLYEEYEELFQYVSVNSGADVKTLWDLVIIADTLYIEDLLGYKLPAWATSVFPTPLHSLKGHYYYLTTCNDKLKKLLVGPFLNELISHFKNPKPKFIMYSSHDLDVCNVMNTIAPDYPEFAPEFATIVIFELWKEGSTKTVRAYLKRDTDEVEELSIKDCPAPCTLAEFKKSFKSLTVTVEERDALCKKLT